MYTQYEMYLAPRCKFYKEYKSKSTKIKYTLKNIPSDWKLIKEKHWTYCISPIPIPVQGWKIHISCSMDQAQEILNTVANLLFSKNIQFKFVSNKSELFLKNSKYADRSSSGKFITIYPPTELIFLTLLDDLRIVLEQFDKGPYILSDNRYYETNIYFRYGGFLPIKNEKGELCILDSYGNKILDIREPQYTLPKFVNVPTKVKKMEQEMEAINNDIGFLANYDITSSLHFSNGGGVYKAKDKRTKKTVVIKEGRLKAGLDGQGIDAHERIHIEKRNLKRLSSVKEVVNIIDYFDVWENAYLVEEYINGEPLNTWISRNYPFVKVNDSELIDYENKAYKILMYIDQSITRIHEKDIGLGDISPSNILVTNDLNIKIIDVETAGDLNQPYKAGLRTIGFGSNLAKNREEADLFACLRVARYLFFPGAPVQDLDIKQEIYIDQYISNLFSERVMLKIKEIEAKMYHLSSFKRKKKNGQAQVLNYLSKDVDLCINSIRNGLLKNIDFRKKQLINGDIRQFEYQDGLLNIMFGGYGVFMSMIRTGSTPESFQEWIKKYGNKKILNRIKSKGLLTGISGICGVLYEVGEKKIALELVKKIDINTINDISLSSGLSGIGLIYLSFSLLEHNSQMFTKATEIANKIIRIFLNKEFIEPADHVFINKGLLNGWSGAALFFISLYNYTNVRDWLSWAEKFILKELTCCETDEKKVLYINDNNKLIPYLLGGTVGVSFPMYEFLKKVPNDLFKEKMEEIEPLVDSTCCYNGGLFRGYSSFILLNTLISKYKNKTNELPNHSLQTLQVFLLKDKENLIAYGEYGYRLSGDLFSGSSGILLALDSLKTQNIYNWLPIPKQAVDNLFP
ncbi:class III lanthionine synthetase LanKC [Enterococcus faecium]|uniref:class III lanthionine synthetase LanKC n=1 Tax=Enterococcus faecium TaxID=1352 RepID=UPI0015E2CD70|nr:class III lanthionine synthetase LanKC [Enterococcus faecium]EME8145400.1 class III lanthionine synthetase LanKC [Enterococcus faecium]EMF0636050.1 class III lanthionine synthetase LanKC [Enterococcus faecium]MCC4054127.1 class III lanthionine synthetase LanKC [Enterococcus faecium]MDQ8327024.1 class III lanthionine synthetase LanKC [Enterococcus faecium]MDV4609527.1 class III lanthionine synthetase LanKC [Enterococcus faecium]